MVLPYHNIILLFVIFSTCCVYPSILYIILCLQSESAVISEIVVTHISFQGIIPQRACQIKMQDVSGLRQCLIGV